MQMAQMRRKCSRQAAQQRIIDTPWRQRNGLAAAFPPARMIRHLAPQGMGHQLMTITNAEQRHVDSHRLPDPVGGPFAPRQTIGYHRPRAGQHRYGLVIRRRQRFIFKHPHRGELRLPRRQQRAKPARQIAMRLANGRRRRAGLDQQ